MMKFIESKSNQLLEEGYERLLSDEDFFYKILNKAVQILVDESFKGGTNQLSLSKAFERFSKNVDENSNQLPEVMASVFVNEVSPEEAPDEIRKTMFEKYKKIIIENVENHKSDFTELVKDEIDNEFAKLFIKTFATEDDDAKPSKIML